MKTLKIGDVKTCRPKPENPRDWPDCPADLEVWASYEGWEEGDIAFFAPKGCQWVPFPGGGWQLVLTATSARNELAFVWPGLGKDKVTKLRRRVEDCLRKNPSALLDVASDLAAKGQIRIDDLI